MKRKLCWIAIGLLMALTGCRQPNKVSLSVVKEEWTDSQIGAIAFEDKAPESVGSAIYHTIVPDAKAYIRAQACNVLSTLYAQGDSIPSVRGIRYTLEDIDGISAKGGSDGQVDIFYSTRYIEKAFADSDTAQLLFETRGVLLHELTHAYQLEPQGIGNYGTNRTFWAFIEGMADAVRVANGGFGPDARPRGGHYDDGYRTTGYFLVWLRDNYDSDFLRKFNASALSVVPWSFDGAIKHVLGDDRDVEVLWHDYQVAVGDLVEEYNNLQNGGEK